MTTFTIDDHNNITALAEAPADASNTFSSQKELAKLTADWPASRLVELWNSFAGVTPFDSLKPVKKFTNRKAAVARIWTAVQRLAANVAPQGATDAPKGKRSGKKATGAKKPARGKERATGSREGSKKAEVLELLRRKQGVTLAEIMKATGWQKHSVRGFLSGAVGKKMGLEVTSFRNDDGERTYKVASA